jgi:protein-tyrosine phosphatase
MGATAVDQSVQMVQPGVHRGLRTTVLDSLREVRYMPESVLHARRRAAAKAQLKNVTPGNVLFVCHGNICRSPFAAAVFARSLPPAVSRSITTRSGGFLGAGRTPPSRALTTGSRFGVDMSAHRSAPITPETVRAADLVVVMSEEQATAVRPSMRADAVVLVLGDLDTLPAKRRTILDPWDGDAHAFEASYARIERCVRELTRLVVRRP